MTTTWSKIVSFFTEGSANKFVKITLYSFALYLIGFIVLAFVVREPIIDWWLSAPWCADLWTETPTASFYCLDVLGQILWIPLALILFGYFVATVTGIIAMYKAIKTHHKWWTVITIYAVVQAISLAYLLLVGFFE